LWRTSSTRQRQFVALFDRPDAAWPGTWNRAAGATPRELLIAKASSLAGHYVYTELRP